MKRELLKIGILLFTVLFCLTGCKEEEKPELRVSDITLIFSAEGESKSFEIKSNTAWTITKSQDATWIESISPTSGNGDAMINIVVAANTSTSDIRNDELTISAKGVMPIKISISQKKAPMGLKVEPDTLIFSAEGESKSFEIKSDTAWTITKSQDATWIESISPTSGNGDATINIVVAANTSTSDIRNDELMVSAEGVMPIKVNISQEKAPIELKIEPDTLIFSAEGGTKYFEVKSNTAWIITGHETQTWITIVSSASGDGNKMVFVTVEANPSAVVARNAALTFVVDGVALKAMNIQQMKHPAPEISSFEPTKTFYGEPITITGRNFSTVKDENIVKLNEFTAEIVSATATTIKVIVPKNLNCSGKISVTARDTTILSIANFTYLPIITVSTLAGSETAGFADGLGSAARFHSPHGVAIDASNNIYVADNGNHSIRKITPTGEVSTLAGNGTVGFRDGLGNAARFDSPRGVAVDASNNVYVADFFNHRIRKITPAGEVTTLAGNGTEGFADGIGTTAQFNRPKNVTLDALGNVYVADQYNHSIRKITPAGKVTTLAGNGTEGFADGEGTMAKFYWPCGITIDALNNIYVADRGNHCIRKITPAGVVTTLAGNRKMGFADGLGNSAQFDHPNGVTVDALGNVYVADFGNHRIRKITPAGEVSTLVGGLGLFTHPNDIAINVSGNTVYVADGNTNRWIRKITIE